MTLFQRMIAHKEIGYNYDYMGYAEFEFGATKEARMMLAHYWMTGTISAKKLHAKVAYGKSFEEFDAIVISSKELLDSLSQIYTSTDKTRLRIEDDKIIGWMTVRGEHCVFIVRDDGKFDEYMERLEKFLKPAVEDSKLKRMLNDEGRIKTF